MQVLLRYVTAKDGRAALTFTGEGVKRGKEAFVISQGSDAIKKVLLENIRFLKALLSLSEAHSVGEVREYLGDLDALRADGLTRAASETRGGQSVFCYFFQYRRNGELTAREGMLVVESEQIRDIQLKRTAADAILTFRAGQESV